MENPGSIDDQDISIEISEGPQAQTLDPQQTKDLQEFLYACNLLEDEEKLRQILLTRQSYIVRQNALIDFLTAGSLNAQVFGEMNESNLAYIAEIKKFYPALSEALLRDLARIIKSKTDKTFTALPAVENDAFEDPFNVGISHLEKIRGDKDYQQMEKMKSFFSGGPKRLVNNLGKLPKELPYNLQTILLQTVINDLTNNQAEINGNADKIWYGYSALVKDVNIDGKFLLFHALQDKLSPETAKKVLAKLIKEALNTTEGRPEDALISAHLTKAGELIAVILEEDPKLLHQLTETLASKNPLASAFALKMLIRYCNRAETASRSSRLVKEMFNSKQSCKDPVCIARVERLVKNLAQPAESQKAILDTLIELPAFTAEMPVELYQEQDTRQISDYLFLEHLALSCFDRNLLKETVGKWMETKPASDILLGELQKKVPADDIDKDKLIEDIILKTTLPLVEIRQMDMKDVFGREFLVHIAPNPDAKESLGSWIVNIEFIGRLKDRFTHENLTLVYDECTLKNTVVPGMQDFAEKIGLLIAHKYFVKQEVIAKPAEPEAAPAETPESPAEEPATPAETPEATAAPDSTPPDSTPPNSEPDSEPGPDSEPPQSDRPYNERFEETLTIDIRDKDVKALADRKKIVKKTLENNKGKVLRLINGDAEGIDLSEIVVHRRIKGIGSGKFIFERVSTEKIKEAVEAGKFAEQEWFVLNTLPHIKTLPYHTFRREMRDEDGQTVLGQIWGVRRQFRSEDAEMAYLHYQDSGFPELSPFSDFLASIQITADAQYKPDEVVQIVTTDGKELHAGKTSQMDVNARIAQRVSSRSWLQSWTDQQKKVLQKEIEDLYFSGLPDDKVLEEVSWREQKIKDIDDLCEQMLQKTSLVVENTPAGVKNSVRLAFGWVITQTSFNKGSFLSLAELKEGKKKKDA